MPNQESSGGSLKVERLTFQLGEGGALPTLPLQYFPCPLKDVSLFIKTYHYSHTYPGGGDYCFKILRGQNLVGAAMFGHMAGNPLASCIVEGDNNPQHYRELMRLVLLDSEPRNSESRFVGWCIRWLKKNTSLIALISFADPKYGHCGVIYKASNWIYTGLQKQDRPRLIINGVEVHPRMAFNRYGTSSVVKLKSMGLMISLQPREPKHRYVYLLREGLQLKQRLLTNVSNCEYEK